MRYILRMLMILLFMILLDHSFITDLFKGKL
jgi:hypothetical protein